jgi:hypothetical protein
MNAVICTDGTSLDLLKASWYVPDMKGLELVSKYRLRSLIMVDVNSTLKWHENATKTPTTFLSR